MYSYLCPSTDEVDENILSYPKYRDKHSTRGSKGLFTLHKEEPSPRVPPSPSAKVCHPKLAYSSSSIFDKSSWVRAVEHTKEEISYKSQGMDRNITVRKFESCDDVFQRLVNDAEVRKQKGKWIQQFNSSGNAKDVRRKQFLSTDNLWKSIESSLLKKKTMSKKPTVKLEVGYNKNIIDSMLFKSDSSKHPERRSPIKLRHLKSAEIPDFRETDLHSRLSTQYSQK